MDEELFEAIGQLLLARARFYNRLQGLGFELHVPPSPMTEGGSNLRRGVRNALQATRPNDIPVFDDAMSGIYMPERLWVDLTDRSSSPVDANGLSSMRLSTAAVAARDPFEVDEVGFVTAPPRASRDVTLDEISEAIDRFRNATDILSSISEY